MTSFSGFQRFIFQIWTGSVDCKGLCLPCVVKMSLTRNACVLIVSSYLWHVFYLVITLCVVADSGGMP